MDLDEGMYYILKDSLSYLETSAKLIDPYTEKAFQYYEALHLGKRKRRTQTMNSKEIARMACEAMEDKRLRILKLFRLNRFQHWQTTLSLPAELTAVRCRPWQIMWMKCWEEPV